MFFFKYGTTRNAFIDYKIDYLVLVDTDTRREVTETFSQNVQVHHHLFVERVGRVSEVALRVSTFHLIIRINSGEGK